jgi:quercetin dioxygenase-like cupin family protein
MFVETKHRIMERKQFIISSVTAGLALTGMSSAFSKSESEDALKPFYLPPDNSVLDPGSGLSIRMKVRSSQTNNQYSCVECAIAPKTMGPAPHVHEKLDEIMYVTEGTVSVLVGQEVYHVEAGGWHLRPRGIVHTFWNATDKIARCTDMYFNQNFDDFLEEIFFKIFPDMAQKKLTPNDPSVMAAIEKLDRKFGIKTFYDQRQAIMDKYGLR